MKSNLRNLSHKSPSSGIRLCGILILLLAAALLPQCRENAPREAVLFDFESDRELDQLHWKCRVLYSLSNTFSTHGSKSLKMELYPSDYPGLAPLLRKTNWKRYGALSFDIYNPQREPVRVTVRIDDRKDYPEYGDRYNNSFVLAPGINSIHIPLRTLTTSSNSRRLNLEEIYRLMIFTSGLKKKTVLYVDYIRLLV